MGFNSITEEMMYINDLERINKLFDWNEDSCNEVPIVDMDKYSNEKLLEVCGLLDEPLI